jgi:D-alanyl-D-alanine carboxypeptidase
MYLDNRYRRPAPIRKRRRARWPFILTVLVLCGIVAGGFAIVSNRHKNTADTQQKGTAQQPTFDKSRFSLSDQNSIWVVVNKRRPLNPKEYVPTDLRAPAIPLRRNDTDPGMQLRDAAATALEQVAAAAKKDGQELMVASAYRSYATQVSVYASEVNGYGQAVADQESARPGYSEHQTGLAVDVEPADRSCEIEDCFADTSEGKWLAANVYKYGFIIRYTPTKALVTGYKYEPWHVRYVGVDLATEMHNKGIETLEEFFDLPAAPNY